MQKLNRFIVFVLLFFSIVCQKSWSQDSLSAHTSKLDNLHRADERKWSLRVPLWIPGFTGTFAYGGITQLPTDNDRNIYERLEGEIGVTFYLIGDLRFSPGKWLFEIDGFHTTLASGLKLQNIDRIEFPASIDGTIIRAKTGYQVYKKEDKDRYFKLRLYPYAGMRYIDLRIYSQGSDILDVDPSWVEPLAGVEVPISYRRWFFSGKFDVGGFSINNHWSWWINANAAYRFSQLFSLGAGWSFIDFNYDQNFELKKLNLGIQLSGPVLSLQFDF